MIRTAATKTATMGAILSPVAPGTKSKGAAKPTKPAAPAKPAPAKPMTAFRVFQKLGDTVRENAASGLPVPFGEGGALAILAALEAHYKSAVLSLTREISEAGMLAEAVFMAEDADAFRETCDKVSPEALAAFATAMQPVHDDAEVEEFTAMAQAAAAE